MLGAVWAGGNARPGPAVAPTQGLCIWVPSAVHPTPSASVQFLLRCHFLGAFCPDAPSLELGLHWPQFVVRPYFYPQSAQPCCISLSQPVTTLGNFVQARAAVVTVGHLWPGRLSWVRPPPWPGHVLLWDLSPGLSSLPRVAARGALGPGLCPPPNPMCHLPVPLQPLLEAGGSQPELAC